MEREPFDPLQYQTLDKATVNMRRKRRELKCPECGETVWDLPHGHKLAKCWNTEGHADGGTLAFTTMEEDA